jgi:hypothetical protein
MISSTYGFSFDSRAVDNILRLIMWCPNNRDKRLYYPCCKLDCFYS